MMGVRSGSPGAGGVLDPARPANASGAADASRAANVGGTADTGGAADTSEVLYADQARPAGRRNDQ